MSEVKIPIDLERVRLTSDGDQEFEAELFTIFVEDCSLRIDRLEEAIASKNLEGIRHEAHTIKGAAANVGARQLCATALQMEQTNPLDADALSTLLCSLRDEFSRVKDFARENYNA